MKKFLYFLITFFLLILIWLLVDMIKINKNYINKNYISFDRSNINSSLLKEIVKKYEIVFFNNALLTAKYYTPFNDDKYEQIQDNFIKKTNPKNIISFSNNDNTFNFDNWVRSHGNNQSNRFSYLNDINVENVKNLKKVWEYSFERTFNKDIQCNPIVKDGIIYAPTNGGSILAINSLNGKLVWETKGYSQYVARRGILIDTQENGDFIYFTNNKHLSSLNSKDGSPNPNFGIKGNVKLDGSSSVTPVIYHNLIIAVTFNKTIEAIDKFNGKKKWIYSFEDPNNGKNFNHIRYFNGGGNPWGGISLDQKRGLLFITTGNPTNYFDGTSRPGENKYSNSLIAFDINKKKIIWYFQEIHHDIWNLDIPAPPILTTLIYKNKKIDVVLALTKLGNTLVFDRLTGESLFDLTYKKAPESTVQGELTSSYQINQSLPEPFAKNLFSFSEITNRNKKNQEYVKNIISKAKFGFFEPNDLKKKNIQFNFHGGAEWMGGSVDHTNRLLYVTANNIAWITELKKDNQNNGKYHSIYKRLKDLDGFPGNKPPWGTISAIDLQSGKILWQTPFGNYSELFFYDENGKRKNSGTENFGGVTGTSGGLLFATGTLDSKFYAFNSKNGEVLWEDTLPFIGSSPPVTFKTNNKQYIVVFATGSVSLSQGYPEKVKFGNKLIAYSLN